MSLGLKEHDEFVKTACHYYMASSHMNCVKKFYIKKDVQFTTVRSVLTFIGMLFD